MCDNYHTHKHADITGWLVKNPRIALHFTPTSGSWLNLVEVFFSIITRQAIRRGSFDSVKELTTAIQTFITGWNDRCHPFVWTKTANEILPHTRKRDSDAGQCRLRKLHWRMCWRTREWIAGTLKLRQRTVLVIFG